jgi:hypothetical protein
MQPTANDRRITGRLGTPIEAGWHGCIFPRLARQMSWGNAAERNGFYAS